jgi:hypothetical protein
LAVLLAIGIMCASSASAKLVLALDDEADAAPAGDEQVFSRIGLGCQRQPSRVPADEGGHDRDATEDTTPEHQECCAAK